VDTIFKRLSGPTQDGLGRTLTESLRMEQMMVDKLLTTEDGKEGPRAFVEKRKPNFQGR
jgi:enoyl-CoA hydratase/carnithine racemase